MGPGNCGGISLLLVLGKIHSTVLVHRLRDWLLHHKKLTLFQMGFTKGTKTVDKIFIIKMC